MAELGPLGEAAGEADQLVLTGLGIIEDEEQAGIVAMVHELFQRLPTQSERVRYLVGIPLRSSERSRNPANQPRSRSLSATSIRNARLTEPAWAVD